LRPKADFGSRQGTLGLRRYKVRGRNINRAMINNNETFRDNKIGKKVSDILSYVPRVLQPPSPSMPLFSKLRLRSKINFSSNIFSIVKSPFFTKPASGGNPASLRKASSVCGITSSALEGC
jgi:hypothetical protein